MTDIPFFSARDVELAVPPARAVEAVRDAFVAHHRGEWTMPPKVYVTNYPAGDFRAMPALGGGHALLKWVTSFPGNPARGLPTVSGIVVLSNAETGELEALLDAAAVTALRTGAAAVLAAETLGRADAPDRGRDRSRRQRPQRRAGPSSPAADASRSGTSTRRAPGPPPRSSAPIVARSRDEALGADVLATVTPGQELLLEEGALRPGQHVSLMGADGPGKAEIAVAELVRTRMFCDDWEQASHGGDLAHAVEAGLAQRGRGRPARSGARGRRGRQDAAPTRSRPSTRRGSRSRTSRSRSPRSRTWATCPTGAGSALARRVVRDRARGRRRARTRCELARLQRAVSGRAALPSPGSARRQPRRQTASRYRSSRRPGWKSASSGGLSPRMASATSSPHASPSTLP